MLACAIPYDDCIISYLIECADLLFCYFAQFLVLIFMYCRHKSTVGS
jgi:hypothetical protein